MSAENMTGSGDLHDLGGEELLEEAAKILGSEKEPETRVEPPPPQPTSGQPRIETGDDLMREADRILGKQ